MVTGRRENRVVCLECYRLQRTLRFQDHSGDRQVLRSPFDLPRVLSDRQIAHRKRMWLHLRRSERVS
jgi:hypothetical protein